MVACDGDDGPDVVALRFRLFWGVLVGGGVLSVSIAVVSTLALSRDDERRAAAIVASSLIRIRPMAVGARWVATMCNLKNSSAGNLWRNCINSLIVDEFLDPLTCRGVAETRVHDGEIRLGTSFESSSSCVILGT